MPASVHTCTRSERASWGPPAGNPSAPGSPHRCTRAASSRQQTSASASTPETQAAMSPLKRKAQLSGAERLKIQQWSLGIQQRVCISSLVHIFLARAVSAFLVICLLPSGLWSGLWVPQECSKLHKIHRSWNKLHFLLSSFSFFSHYFCPSPSLYQHLAGFLFSQVCCFFIQLILKLLQLLLRRKHFSRIN